MLHHLRTASIAALFALVGAQLTVTDAHARAPKMNDGGAQRIAIVAMIEGAEHEGPPAHRAFCARQPDACSLGDSPQPGAVAALGVEGMEALERFNRAVNHSFAPKSDSELYGVSDFWTLPVIGADCEDYVLHKRQKLLEAGWPAESVLIGVVRSPTGAGYHAVLILRTNRGELVLDNMRDEVLGWRETGYDWVIRQSSADPRRWVVIDNGAAPRIGA